MKERLRSLAVLTGKCSLSIRPIRADLELSHSQSGSRGNRVSKARRDLRVSKGFKGLKGQLERMGHKALRVRLELMEPTERMVQLDLKAHKVLRVSKVRKAYREFLDPLLTH